jgi:hypothetical protein
MKPPISSRIRQHPISLNAGEVTPRLWGHGMAVCDEIKRNVQARRPFPALPPTFPNLALTTRQRRSPRRPGLLPAKLQTSALLSFRTRPSLIANILMSAPRKTHFLQLSKSSLLSILILMNSPCGLIVRDSFWPVLTLLAAQIDLRPDDVNLGFSTLVRATLRRILKIKRDPPIQPNSGMQHHKNLASPEADANSLPCICHRSL